MCSGGHPVLPFRTTASSGEIPIEPMTDLIHALETFVLTFSTDVYDFMGWFGVVVLMSIESTAIPLPSEVIMPLAGWRLVLDRGHGVAYVFLAGFFHREVR
jgi:membrane protein DedA with SNARE-associated domain